MAPLKFAFPENSYLLHSTIKNRDKNGYFIDVDITKPLNNIINIDKVDYCFTYLNGAVSGNKGGNSILLRLYELQNIDQNDVKYDEPDLILKISKPKTKAKVDQAENRFRNEIDCLIRAKTKSQNIMEIFHYGECNILNEKGKYENHIFYTMEYAPFDLKTYIEEKHNILTIENKIMLCLSLCNGLSELWDMQIYHRDIKPDNIFFTYDSNWKIGDLGLASDQNRTLDKVAEFVGPKGWLSPEAMNKYLSENKGFSFKYNCIIDHQSDIFQLGKVFWYIFQYNSPEGCINESDFLVKNSLVYQTIKPMLNHSKSKRPGIKDVMLNFKRIEEKLLKQKVA